jgi:hypothetical protein
MIRRGTNCYVLALFLYVFLKFLLLVGGDAGGYVGKDEHFPVLRSKRGKRSRSAVSRLSIYPPARSLGCGWINWRWLRWSPCMVMIMS